MALLEWEEINAGSGEAYPHVYPHLFSWDLALLPRNRYVRVNRLVIVLVHRGEPKVTGIHNPLIRRQWISLDQLSATVCWRP